MAIEYSDTVLNDFPGLKEKIKKLSHALTIVRIPAVKDVEEIVARLAHSGAEIIHIVADYCGRESQRFDGKRTGVCSRTLSGPST